MSQIITLIKNACENLGLTYKSIDNNGVFLRVELKEHKYHYFIAGNLGLNDEIVEKICRDKSYTYDLLADFVRMPHLSSYIDSHPPDLFSNYKEFKSHQEISNNIVENNQLPLVLKPNSKSMGTNVFSCSSQEEVAIALDKIFNKDSFVYDHVLLAQKKINISKEFRVIVYNQEIQFVYQKDNTSDIAKFTGNLSPLHFDNSKSVLLDESVDLDVLEKIKQFIKPVFNKMKLNYAGLDVAIDNSGELYLLEINSKPGFSYFVRDNGAELIIKMFEKILIDLKLK